MYLTHEENNPWIAVQRLQGAYPETVPAFIAYSLAAQFLTRAYVSKSKVFLR